MNTIEGFQIKKILISDPHPIILRGLRDFFEEKTEFAICGSLAHFPKEDDIKKANPHIIITELVFNEHYIFDLIKSLRQTSKALHVLVFSIHSSVFLIERALKCGASGYIVKEEPLTSLLHALEEIKNNSRYVRNDLKDRIFQKIIAQPQETSLNLIEALTDREFEVFVLIGKGYTVNDIAEKLKLSMKTVNNYRDKIKDKLQIIRSCDLTRTAIEWNITNRII